MSTQEWIVLLTVGFLLKESTAAVQIPIPNSNISVKSHGNPYEDKSDGTPYKVWRADEVIDGIVNDRGKADDCGCCAALLRPAWVELTLDKTYIVEKIVVLGRTDEVTTQFDNITLSLGRQNTSLQDEALTFQNQSARAILAPPSELDVVRVSGGKGQTIDTYMTICEIMIYRQADCLPGKYSVNCSKECHCLSGPCESVTGNCVTATCKDGWRGLACNETCDQGLFGWNCSTQCHCLHQANCNHVSGNCSNEQCEPGWTNSNCSVACKHGFYGPSCSMECHCDKCNPVNGSCVMSLQCHAGYRMENGFCKPHEQIGGSTTFNAIGVVSGCIVAVVIIIGITFLTVYYRRQQLHAAKGHSKLSLPDQIEARFNNGFDHINRTNDGKNVLVQYKAEVASKNVCRLFSGKENLVPCDDNDYYSFRTPLGVGIKILELWDYIHEKCQSSTFFEEEFKKFRCGLIHKHDVASSEENRGKTRYKQMYAYDHNRVPLTKEIDGDSEYINASYIHGFEKAKKFIASQGTTEKNLVDFWSMIWQQRVDKIVMLTNLIEMGTMKCLQYWPEELNSVCKYGRIDVKYIDVEEMFDYNIRTFTIKKGHDGRLVKQFHFKSWPDKGVPDTAWCLVDFWRAVNTQEEHQSPILVHCSAGVGRTGTFIALDNLISQAQIESCVRPFQIVEALREQRVSMVQTKEQYAYLHEAVAEALLVGTHHVMKRQFESVHRFMNAKDSISTITRLEKQLELLKQSVESRERHLQLGAKPEAEYGNSGPHVTEIDVYRPQQQRKSKPPDEINIHTFNGLTGTIVLRKPNEQQLPMFWSRLKKLGSKTLIDLASGDIELKHLLINRKDGTHALKGPSAIKEEHKNGFVEITYSMTNETFRDKTIKHFVLSSWKEVDIPTDKKPLLEMIGAVYTWQSELTEDTPILILDSCGYRKCGVVAVLLNEIYRILEQNGRINIVQSVKTMVHENSLLIRSKMQYKFCYDVILDFVQQQGVYQNY